MHKAAAAVPAEFNRLPNEAWVCSLNSSACTIGQDNNQSSIYVGAIPTVQAQLLHVADLVGCTDGKAVHYVVPWTLRSCRKRHAPDARNVSHCPYFVRWTPVSRQSAAEKLAVIWRGCTTLQAVHVISNRAARITVFVSTSSGDDAG